MNRGQANQLMAGFRWARVLGALALAVFSGVSECGAHVAAENGLSSPFALRPMWLRNDGQVDQRVAFYTTTFAGTAAVLKDGRVTYTLRKKTGGQGSPVFTGASRSPGAEELWALFEVFEGGTVKAEGRGVTGTAINWLLGADPSRWRKNLETFAAVDLGEVWPGVRVSLRAGARDIERIVTVLPSGDPGSVCFRILGASRLKVEEDGSLSIETGLGSVRWAAPVAYQDTKHGHRLVPVRYRVEKGDRVGLVTGGYDRSAPLVIDPYLSATFLGGGQDDTAYAVLHTTVTGVGQVFFVAGETASSVFPVGSWAAGYQGSNSGGRDAFLARVEATSASANNVVTFFGGPGDDLALAVTTDGDPASSVYIAGETSSSTLPATTGAAQALFAGGLSDGFVARFSPDLTSVNATYLGGGADDTARSIRFVGGDVLIGGTTASDSFPGTSGGGQSARAGGKDWFLTRMSSSLATIVQSTYVGGSDDDDLSGIETDGADVYAVGSSKSNDFPSTGGGVQAAPGGGYDGVIARISMSLTSAPAQATYVGGSGFDRLYSLGIAGSWLFAVGETNSSSLIGSPGVIQSTFGGGFADGLVIRMDKNLTSGLLLSFFGGSAEDKLVGLDVQSGSVVAAGVTGSTSLPVLGNSLQPAPGGNLDGLVIALSSDLSSGQSSFFGGSQMDELFGVVTYTDIAGLSRVGVVGSSQSDDLPALEFAAQLVRGGGKDAVLADLPISLRFECPPLPINGCVQPVKSSLTIRDKTVAGVDPNLRDRFVWNWQGTGTATSFADFGNPMIGGKTDYLVCVYDSSGLVDQLALQLKVQRGGICGAGGQACWKKVPKRGAQTGYAFRDPTLAQSGLNKILLRRGPVGLGRDVIKVVGKGGGLALPGPVNSSQYAYVDPRFRVQLLRSDGARCWESQWDGTGVRSNSVLVFRAVCGGKGQPSC